MAQQKMASGEISLQLFPPPPSKATKPKRKPSRRKTAGLMATKTTPAAVTAVVEHSKSPATVKEIVIHVSENSSNQTKMSAPTRSMTPAASPPTVLTERSRATSPAASTATQPPPPPPPLTEKGSLLSRPSLPLSRATSPAWTKQPPEKPFSGANLMRSNSEARLNAPIRSIFPPYNPAVPLAHQNYRPTQGSPTNIPSQYISKEPYSPSLYSNGSPGPTPGNPGSSPGRGCLSAPSAVTTFLAGVLSANPAPRYSTKDDLVDLWEAANGQGTVETGKTFLLKINRYVLTSNVKLLLISQIIIGSKRRLQAKSICTEKNLSAHTVVGFPQTICIHSPPTWTSRFMMCRLYSHPPITMTSTNTSRILKH